MRKMILAVLGMVAALLHARVRPSINVAHLSRELVLQHIRRQTGHQRRLPNNRDCMRRRPSNGAAARKARAH
jgi:hypothetical protein